jgi:hypothetical protein
MLKIGDARGGTVDSAQLLAQLVEDAIHTA